MSNENCESGCNCFTGGEIRHQRTCVNYPDSLTEMYDLAMAKINYLEDNQKQIIKESEEDSGRIKGLEGTIRCKDSRIAILEETNGEHEKNLAIQQDKIKNLSERLDRSHNAHGTALETIDSLRDDVARLKDIIKRKNEVIQLIARDLE